MGKNVFTRDLYTAAKSTYSVGEREVTKAAEQKARKTGKLEPLVDPAEFGVIRLSLPRVEKLDNGRYELSVGTPMPIETRLDTTASMGGSVDAAMEVLPEAFASWQGVLEGYDIQVATGIFGDTQDNFPLCRPQFEMEAHKIVEQLTMMTPERDGGDAPEDPDLGMFGGAFLTRTYANAIGLKGYDFTVTDAPGRGFASENQLTRVYGKDVFDKIATNGYQKKINVQISLDDIWEALCKRAHAFVLLVGTGARNFWTRYAKNRVVVLPSVKYLPHVQAAIIGLTEGTLKLDGVTDFLVGLNLDKTVAKQIAVAVSEIPIGEQAKLPAYANRPMKGDLFADKPDIWEETNLLPSELAEDAVETENDEVDEWK